MDESNNLILNLVTENSSDNERTSLRSKLKNVGGGWKEKKKVRKFLKKEIRKHSRNNLTDKQRFLQKSITTVNNNESIQENNLNSQKNLVNKAQVISSIFSYNPEIPNVRYDNNSKSIDHKPSNAPIDDISSFKSMGLDNDLVENMKNKLGVEKPTNIQSKAIPVLMSSINKNSEFDVIVQSETGSGKTLIYLLPILHRLINITIDIQNNGLLSRSIGTLAIILTPTRELAIQVVSVLECLTNIPPSKLTSRRHLNHWIVIGNVIGGKKKQSEKARLRKGINILVCTPGRLLDHLQNTKSFLVKNLCWLILDEADRLLELGFEETLQSIVKILDEKTTNSETKKQLFSSSKFWPKRRQTILCSATLKDDVKRLAGYTLFNPIFIGGKDDFSPMEEKNEKSTKFSTPNQLKQSYIITPAKLRLVTLLAILKLTFNVKQNGDLVNRKIIVFVSCCDSVDFHFDLFKNAGKFSKLDGEKTDDDKLQNNDQSIFAIIPAKIFRLHGDLTQNIRTEIFNEFSRSNSGILFCTDVAARGLDLPDVAKIIQYDPPTDLKDYVHRVGRTARLGKEGEAILFILPSEIEYINILKSQEIFAKPVRVETILGSLVTQNERNQKEYEVVATNIQLNFERYVLSNPKRTTLAQKAYSSYIRAYATHTSTEKHIFHVKKLHLGHIAKSFGLREAPSNINNIISSKLDNKGDHKKEKILNKDQKSIKKRNFEIMNEFSIGNYKSMIGPTTKRNRK
ncbi:DEAD-domain-containing protein [Rhizophagus clarus]|uniref:ATP-dependent RNA helicase n=1 Tax=Rhizophagus clarus TaxID=94130 RepID=A0A8H3LJX2_9GLOM|nr:DEAD-domain-containing protein [Rhizophagus clarus]